MNNTNSNTSGNTDEGIDVLARAQELRAKTQLPNATAQAQEIHGDIESTKPRLT
jgi:hypothetical protein